MDSTASFRDRAKAIGLPDADIQQLVDVNLGTFGQFAFLSSFQPGSTDEQPFVDAIKKILGAEPSEGHL